MQGTWTWGAGRASPLQANSVLIGGNPRVNSWFDSGPVSVCSH